MIRSIIYAISGIAATVKSERNMRIHLAAAVAVVVLGAWLGLDGREWAAVKFRSRLNIGVSKVLTNIIGKQIRNYLMCG